MNLHVKLADGVGHQFEVEAGSISTREQALNAVVELLNVPLSTISTYNVDFNGNDIVVSPNALAGETEDDRRWLAPMEDYWTGMYDEVNLSEPIDPSKVVDLLVAAIERQQTERLYKSKKNNVITRHTF